MILVETGRVNKSKLSSENKGCIKPKKTFNTPSDASMQDENSADGNDASLHEDKLDDDATKDDDDLPQDLVSILIQDWQKTWDPGKTLNLSNFKQTWKT